MFAFAPVCLCELPFAPLGTVYARWLSLAPLCFRLLLCTSVSFGLVPLALVYYRLFRFAIVYFRLRFGIGFDVAFWKSRMVSQVVTFRWLSWASVPVSSRFRLFVVVSTVSLCLHPFASVFTRWFSFASFCFQLYFLFQFLNARQNLFVTVGLSHLVSFHECMCVCVFASLRLCVLCFCFN